MEQATDAVADKAIVNLWPAARSVVLLVVVAGFALFAGLRLRRAAWDFTDGAHFKGDVNNAFFWGQEASSSGLFHLYDAIANQTISEPGRKMDYPPLRLAMATAWSRWAKQNYPDATAWQDDYDFTAPLLNLNTSAELASCVLIFLLIRLWRERQEHDTRTTWPHGVWPAMAGALLFWFNPAIIWDGHCWPQWDVWPIPFFLAAVLLASLDWWLVAGICLAIGASLKGQLLLTAPVLFIWPIARLHFGCAFRLIAGFLVATLLIAAPWMHPSVAAIWWAAATFVGVECVLPFVFESTLSRRAVLTLAIVGIGLAWPWRSAHVPIIVRAGPSAMLCLLALSRWLPHRLRVAAIATVVGTLIILMIPLFNASPSWFIYGYEYGTEKFAFMVTGSGAYNLPRMMVVYLHWPPSVSEPVTLPLIGIQVTFTTATRIIYGIFLILCGIGAAIHDRRGDTRFLASMVTPWLLFFTILTQMHGRYTIWAAGLSALLAGVGPGLSLLGLLVSTVSLCGMIENQLLFSRRWSPETLSILRGCDPGLGWILLLAAWIYLYYALMPRLRSIHHN